MKTETLLRIINSTSESIMDVSDDSKITVVELEYIEHQAMELMSAIEKLRHKLDEENREETT